ncbi:MAG: ATP-binding protein [Chloroflexota bacterium]
MSSLKPLDPAQLYTHCDPQQFEFETTEALKPTLKIIGQARAVESVRFGIGIRQAGYNLFALGPNGVGKFTAVRHFLQERAATDPTPPDLCYINNFNEPHQPNGLQLPAGIGVSLCQDMRNFIEELQAALPTAFESEEYHTQRQAINREMQHKQETALEALSQKAQERGIALMQTQNGLGFAPEQDGEVLSPEAFRALPVEEREQIQAKINEMQQEMQKIMRQVPLWSREAREKVKKLNEELVTVVLEPFLTDLQETYAEFSRVTDYLQEVAKDIQENVDKFLQAATLSEGDNPIAADGDAPQQGSGHPNRAMRASAFFNRYEVNVLVTHKEDDGAPVIYENHPTYQNLVGRVEHIAQMGALITDFTLIKPGALHRASGGYLLLDARKLLLQPYAWESLKRSLQADEVRIESLGQATGIISTVSLEPEPQPLEVKVVLLGDRMLYYMLSQADPDFGELFKVAADFETDMERSQANDQLYARLVSTLVQKDGLTHFDRSAVARIIEHSARLAGDAEKLTTHMQTVADLLREASYWANEAEADLVTAAHVQQAIEAELYRNGRLRDRIQETILRQTILIDTEGMVVGQINGLSVLRMGNTMFGQPNRITARVRLGKGEIVDIERQVEMGGPLHSKGVLILTGFLGGRYATKRPLTLSASLVFEQSYGGVDGDSASAAELFALLSALADVPIKQSLAITGSVNQHGRVQAIGGVNEKIEGFFDICRARGLTGEQGVLVPQANVKNLMLHQDVIEAVSEGQFAVYAIETIDQGIEILTGIVAGEPDEEGNYPEGSINHLVAERLTRFAQKQRHYNSGVMEV